MRLGTRTYFANTHNIDVYSSDKAPFSRMFYIPFLRLLLAGEDRQPVTVPKNEQSEFRLEERPEMCKHGIDAFEICNEIQPTA